MPITHRLASSTLITAVLSASNNLLSQSSGRLAGYFSTYKYYFFRIFSSIGLSNEFKVATQKIKAWFKHLTCDGLYETLAAPTVYNKQPNFYFLKSA